MISDDEIGLIKAMMARGMKAGAMQFYFNREDRQVNTGRFADIRAGRYGRSAKIAAASDQDLQTFLDDHAAGRIPSAAPRSDPLSSKTLKAMFERVGSTVRVVSGETDSVECKESFHPKGKWLRAVAALANNQGGYILFGIRDHDDATGPLTVIGMKDSQFQDTDPAVITRRIRSTFDPTPVFRLGTIPFGKKIVGVMHVEQHPARPIVATNGNGDVVEGDIYFRYPGQSARIKYSDLRALLDERDQRIRAELTPMINRLVQLGPGRAMIADLATNELSDGRRSIRIDKALAEKLTFIKEGHFVEHAGAPALRLVGEVQIGDGTPAIKKGIVTRADMLADFIDGTSRAEPVDYLRFAVEVSNGEWLPIRHFARIAGMDDDALLTFIDESSGRPTNKSRYRTRIEDPDAAFVMATGAPAKWLEALIAGQTIQPSTATEAGEIGRMLQGIGHDHDIPCDVLLTIAGECVDRIAADASGVLGSHVRRGLARLDELIDRRRSSPPTNVA